MPVTATTTLPDAQQPTLDTTTENQIGASWTDVTDNGDYRIQLRQTSDSTWFDQETLVDQATTTTTFTTLLDGEQYELRLRTETEHVTGAWTSPVAATTILPAPTDATIRLSSWDRQHLTWTDNADNEDGYRITYDGTVLADLAADTTTYEATSITPTSGQSHTFTIEAYTEDATASTTVAETIDETRVILNWQDPPQSQTGFKIYESTDGGTTYSEIADVAASTRHYETRDLIPNTNDHTDYTYRVDAYNGGSTTLWSLLGTTQSIASTESYQLVLRDDGSLRTVTDLTSVSPARTHTGKSDFRAVTPYDTTLEPWAFADAFLYYQDTFLFRGRFTTISSDEAQGTTTLAGDGIAGDLEHGSATTTYTQTPVWEAIDDYWSTYTPFTASTTQPTPSTVATDDQVQEADTTTELESITTLAADDPVTITNGELHLAPIAFVTEAENYTANNGTGDVADGVYSGGTAEELINQGEWFEIQFDPDHDIPGEDVGFYTRFRSVTGASEITYRLYEDGAEVANWVVTQDTDTYSSVEWADLAYLRGTGSRNYPDHDISAASTYTLRVEATTTEDGIEFDVIAVADTRYAQSVDNLDNDNGGTGGYLDDPRLLADAITVTFDEVQRPYNVTGASADVTAADTSAPFAIAFSNDGGTTWEPDPGTTTPTATFAASYGTRIQARVTLGAYGTRSSATPKQGYLGQTLGDWDLFVDGDDLAVIDSMTVEQDHLKNLQKLHDYGDHTFVPKHDEDELKAESFRAGTKSATASWTTTNRRRTIDYTDYANKITVKGETQASGARVEATVSYDAEINSVGEVHRTVIDPTLGSHQECVSRARSLLEERVASKEVTGSIQVFPTLVDPGYVYSVSEWGVDVELEQVTYSVSGESARGTLSFDVEDDVADLLAGLRRETQRSQSVL